MGQVHQPHDPKHQGQPQCCAGVQAAKKETIDEML